MALISRKDIIIVSGIIGIAALTGLWVVMETSPPPADTAQEAPVLTPEQIETARVEKQFEDVLNGLLRQVAEKLKSYGVKRKVLSEIIRGENNTSLEMVNENLAFAQGLRGEMATDVEDFMRIFTTTETAVLDITRTQDKTFQEKIMTNWEAVKKKQTDLYTEYFLVDNDIAGLHEKILQFFSSHYDQLTINPDDFAFVFTGADLRTQYDAFLQEIEALKTRQKEMLAAANPQTQP